MERIYEMTIKTDDGLVAMPAFTSTMTLPTVKRLPDWKRPDEIIEHLKKIGAPIKTKASLINYERKGMLTAMRVSEKKVYYDLNEVEKIFDKKK